MCVYLTKSKTVMFAEQQEKTTTPRVVTTVFFKGREWCSDTAHAMSVPEHIF